MNLQSKHCDIVIPIWNNLELTRDCIDSIKKHTRYPYRIVAIDNASEGPTREYLDSLEKEDAPKTVIIRNAENTGFVRAVNQGMRFSDAEYVCVTNNDTIATDGWLSELVEILERDDTVGLINPSSNSSCQFPGKLTIDAYAKTLKKLKGKYQELYSARAFAMVVRRSLIEKIGYLDETYGMGYYDDSDYSKRTQGVGYKAVRAKASYVYHRESQSFDKISEKSKIFIENENKFISKWGRPIRVAYLVPSSGRRSDFKKISSNINKIARMGHQAWIFTSPGVKKELSLIDHESIRFFSYPALFFGRVACYKIRKRKKKKKLHLILSNNERLYRWLNKRRDSLGADTLLDKDFSLVEKKIREISYGK